MPEQVISMTNILMFNIQNSEKRRKIKTIAAMLRLSCREVSPEEFGQTVGALAGLVEADPDTGEKPESFTDEMLVMNGLAGGAFQQFLNQLRRQKASVTLKAVVTEHNAKWNCSELHRAIASEHEAMKNSLKSIHRD